ERGGGRSGPGPGGRGACEGRAGSRSRGPGAPDCSVQTPTGRRAALMGDTDVSEETQRAAVECVVWAREKCSAERETASLTEREFEKKHGPTWHCIVGKFGSFVSPETKHFIFLRCGVNDLLFKAGESYGLLFRVACACKIAQ
ncbi:dynein light chain 2, cytoplasmic-like, partial [Chroicocephalus ridibundus]|uniref:dynein light chain 2, cytoplasmic-like n=1 Tax=Chroicocephalus ridibundus TaxID=1192867 RepID=UPI002FDD5564